MKPDSMEFFDIVVAERPSRIAVLAVMHGKKTLEVNLRLARTSTAWFILQYCAANVGLSTRLVFVLEQAVKVGHPLLKDSELTSTGIRSHMVTINYRHANGENSKSGKGSLTQERCYNIYTLWGHSRNLKRMRLTDLAFLQPL